VNRSTLGYSRTSDGDKWRRYELMYVSDGDSNGVCSFLGTAMGTQVGRGPSFAPISERQGSKWSGLSPPDLASHHRPSLTRWLTSG